MKSSFCSKCSPWCIPRVEYQTPFQSVTPPALDQHFSNQSEGDAPESKMCSTITIACNKPKQWKVRSYLIDDGNDCQLSFKCQVEVSNSLCLNALHTTAKNLNRHTYAASTWQRKHILVPDWHQRSTGHPGKQKSSETLRSWSRRDPEEKIHMHSLSKNNFTGKWHVSPGITNSSLGHIQLILILISAVSTVCL